MLVEEAIIPSSVSTEFMRLRGPGMALLKGHGLEVGALHEHAVLPEGCTVEYVDAISRDEAATLFPEIEASELVDPDHIRDLDQEGLSGLADEGYDFVILSHVIEHVADPLAVLAELFRVVRPNGLVVIAAPDKRFTFDRNRTISDYAQLLEAHRSGIRRVDDDRYLDFLNALYPAIVKEGGVALDEAMTSVRKRREHAHVWDSASFTAFLWNALHDLHIEAEPLYMVTGELNSLEHFSVWRKYGQPIIDSVDPPDQAHEQAHP
jgi:SAM-dependent methyltransferase